MRYPSSLLDEIRARLPVSQVVGRTVALKRKGREFAGLSPFKTEKTPSFFVNDQKGFYHCFASGEHGDIFTFLMMTEGLSFPEAVERLAEDAGVALPKPAERPREVEEERTRWYRLLEEAARFFEARLQSGEGREALRYVADKRGLSPATIGHFRLGFAPNSRTALSRHLTEKGFSRHDICAMGLMIHGDDIPEPYDRFRNRVMFPITDAKGRVIAFGGRALDANQPAKYLNSPETPLFHKGRTLYNADNARRKAFDAGRVVVVEGYMDVIALHEAGIGEAVAPLGTALTEDQLQILWRFTAEPTLCFDGDSAGRKAAHRAVDTAIHMLKPGVSLKFAFLPDKLDPDDLIRDQGRTAFETVLSKAKSFADVLFEREWDSGNWETPERRAKLEAQIGILTARIADDAVRSHYTREMRDRLFQAWSAMRGFGGAGHSQAGARFSGHSGSQAGPRGAIAAGAGGRQARLGGWPASPGQPHRGRRGQPGSLPSYRQGRTSSLRLSRLVATGGRAPSARELLILRALVNHPFLIEENAEEIARIEFGSERLKSLRDAILSAHASDFSLDSGELRSHLQRDGWSTELDQLETAAAHKCDRFSEPESDAVEVEDGWRHALRLHDRLSTLRKALEDAERSWRQASEPEAFERIRELQREIEHLGEF